MEWLTCIKKTIDYIENNILESKSAFDLSNVVYMSSFYLEKGFRIMTGYSISEYMRNRRLYLSALELLSSDKKIIDIALKYDYETPESFTKAFTRFHGFPPSQIAKNKSNVKIFLPLNITINILGGSKMDYKVEKMNSFTVIGFAKEFESKTSYKEIPLFWDEVINKYHASELTKKTANTIEEKAICENRIGTYGICIEKENCKNSFTYMIAGNFVGKNVPNSMKTFTIPALQWVKFRCTGPLPGALQSVNTKIFKEWLPGNTEWELVPGFNIEWYSQESNTQDPNYISEIWIPVKAK